MSNKGAAESGARKIVANTGWLVFGRIAALVASLMAGALVARYLGPDRYGSLVYCLTIVVLTQRIVNLGLHGIVVREVTRNPELRDVILGTTFWLRVVAGFIGWAVIVISAFLTAPSGSDEAMFVAVLGVGSVMHAFLVLESWFHARVDARPVVMAQAGSALLCAAGDISLVLAGVSLTGFVVWRAAAFVLQSALFLAVYGRAGGFAFLGSLDFRRGYSLLSQSWILMLAGLGSILYMRIDQVMLRHMVDTASVGVYSVAAGISELWLFVPAAVMTSAFPGLLKLDGQGRREEYLEQLRRLFAILWLLGLFFAITICVAGWLFIPIIYGAAYGEASLILAVHVWGGVFLAVRTGLSKWILVENALAVALFSQLAGAVTNVLLNFLLIPSLGGMGAATATVIGYAVAGLGAFVVYPRSRESAVLAVKSLYDVPTVVRSLAGELKAFCFRRVRVSNDTAA